jgi:hypothetical protein
MIVASGLLPKRTHDATMKISSPYRRGALVFIDLHHKMTMPPLGRYIAWASDVQGPGSSRTVRNSTTTECEAKDRSQRTKQ